MASNMQASSEYSFDSPQPNENDQQPPKRKGGRKAKYTDEGRKQRNRDAQAAFRERRTEYIKELEEKVTLYGNKLRTLEATKSNTATECLMLRYKNSLLERILLHKGVDVNAELNSALWKPPSYSSSSIPHSPIIDRNRSLKRKSKYDTTAALTSHPTLEASTLPRLSPESTSAPETEILTPPSAIELPQPKRSKTHHSTTDSSDHPGRREEPTKFFSSGGDMSLEVEAVSRPKAVSTSQKPAAVASMTDFLDVGYDLYEMLNPAPDELDLGMDFPMLPDGLAL